MKILKNTEEAFIGVSLMIVMSVLFVNVVLRYFFSANTTWAEEFIRYAIIWITFIGSSVCFRRSKHVGVEVLRDFLSDKGKKVLHIIINSLAIIFMLFIVKYGIDLVLFSINTGQVAAALQIKTFWVYLSIPLGALLSLLHLGVDTYLVVRNEKQI